MQLISIRVLKLKLLEFCRFNKGFALILLLGYWFRYEITRKLAGEIRAIPVMGKLHRHINWTWSRKWATCRLQQMMRRCGPEQFETQLRRQCRIDQSRVTELKSQVVQAQRPFDRRLIILSPPVNNLKGVLLVKFTENFRYLPEVFDLGRLERDYQLVLEPSGCGYFDEDILALSGRCYPILVLTPEPVDRDFLLSIDSNLVPVDIGANCWVDHRVFSPLSDMPKRYDVVMVSFWGNKKRHYHLFEAMARVRPVKTIRAALIGVPWPHTLDWIRSLARHYGVDDCIDYFENISQTEINILLNQSKVSLLLSKREGINKAVVEAMFANTPSFILEGLNFGYRYPNLNSSTGGIIPRDGLADFLVNLDNMLLQGSYTPRAWVLENMSPEHATSRLCYAIKQLEDTYQLRVNTDLRKKVNNPDCDYFDTKAWTELATYYAGLKAYLKE